MKEFWSQHTQMAYNELGHFASDEASMDAPQEPDIAPVFSYSLLKFTGETVADFLQGQATIDINTLALDEACPCAFVNLKGRVESNGFMFRSNDAYFYMCKTSSAEIQKSILTKFAMFSRTNIELIERPIALIICAAEFNAPMLNLRLGDESLSLAYCTNTDEQAQLAEDISNLQMQAYHFGDSSYFTQRLCELGLAIIDASLSETLLPQELNLDLAAGVSFNKGCYRGQEVVARLHFKGRAKTRSAIIRSKTTISDDTLKAGAVIESPEGKKIGQLIQFSYQNGELIAIVALRVEQLKLLAHSKQDHALLIANQSLQVQMCSAPYAIPIEPEG